MSEPTRFGKYSLLDRISVGGMAEVFRARNPTGGLVAIKRILPNVAEDASFIKMFVEEARITSQLVHPNVCRIFELGRREGVHFIAMEYIHGKDLVAVRNRLRKSGLGMPFEIAVAILAQALDGLDYAHKKKDGFGRSLDIVHRDCSPHNLMIGYDGTVKVIDFGIAKAKSTMNKSVAGVLKGKFAYMSPEQVVGKAIDKRTDIFALGIVLYELVTGERLFMGDSDFAILDKVRRAEFKPAREIVPDLPKALETVIGKALSPDPNGRYATCAAMKAELVKYKPATVDALAAWMGSLFREDLANEREDLADALPPAAAFSGSEPSEPEIEVLVAGSEPVVKLEPEELDLEAALDAAPSVPAQPVPAVRESLLDLLEDPPDVPDDVPDDDYAHTFEHGEPDAAADRNLPPPPAGAFDDDPKTTMYQGSDPPPSPNKPPRQRTPRAWARPKR